MLNLPRQGHAIVLPPDAYFVDRSFSLGLINRQEILGDPQWVLWAYYPDGWSSVIFRVNPRVMFTPPALPSDP